jgi:endonuclease YncB( thermonuclease family)
MEDYLRRHGPSATPFTLAGQTLPGLIVSCYDGDTLTIVLPVFGHCYKFTVRIDGIDTPEIKSKDAENKLRAVRARNRVLQLAGLTIGLDAPLTKKEVGELLAKVQPIVEVACKGFDKYGRLLAVLSVGPTCPSFADVLIAERLGYVYGGATKLTEAEQLNAL